MAASWVFVKKKTQMLLSLKRWPDFRASARSESCSRCSAGLISALPLVPHRAPAAALASFPRFRSFRIVLPLQRVTLFPVPCHGMQCNAMLRSAARCHAFSYNYDMQCLTAQCHVMLCNVTCCPSAPCSTVLDTATKSCSKAISESYVSHMSTLNITSSRQAMSPLYKSSVWCLIKVI